MKIVLFNRDKRIGNFSIEQLFHFLSLEFSKKLDLSICQCPSNFNFIKLLLWAYKNKGEINHITGDVHYLAFVLPKTRTILTVHDIGHYEHNLKGIKKIIYKYIWLTGPINKVKLITTISEYSKNQLINNFRVDPNKIFVIYNPLLPFFKYRPRNSINKKPVILQIGSGNNKNLINLIKAVVNLEVKLLLINNLKNKEVNSLLSEHDIDFEQRFNLSNDELLKAYYDSDFLFFASLYEGFGMPIIESQAMGRPVITSNISCMPEIASDSALLVSPHDILEIRNAILNLINDKTLYNKLVLMGFENIKRFDIAKSANQYTSLYHKVKNEIE